MYYIGHYHCSDSCSGVPPAAARPLARPPAGLGPMGPMGPMAPWPHGPMGPMEQIIGPPGPHRAHGTTTTMAGTLI